MCSARLSQPTIGGNCCELSNCCVIRRHKKDDSSFVAFSVAVVYRVESTGTRKRLGRAKCGWGWDLHDVRAVA